MVYYELIMVISTQRIRLQKKPRTIITKKDKIHVFDAALSLVSR